MSALHASKCEQCDRVESCRAYMSHPDGWWLIFGPEGRKDFCSKSCMVLHFRPFVVTRELGS